MSSLWVSVEGKIILKIQFNAFLLKYLLKIKFDFKVAHRRMNVVIAHTQPSLKKKTQEGPETNFKKYIFKRFEII